MVANQLALKPEDELFNYRDAARFLGCSPGTLQVWISTGRHGIPYLKIGKLVRFRRSTLTAWMNSRERGGTKCVTRITRKAGGAGSTAPFKNVRVGRAERS